MPAAFKPVAAEDEHWMRPDSPVDIILWDEATEQDQGALGPN
jgi:hypothetical protein